MLLNLNNNSTEKSGAKQQSKKLQYEFIPTMPLPLPLSEHADQNG
jgi:hypothetical protein